MKEGVMPIWRAPLDPKVLTKEGTIRLRTSRDVD
jgi:hypothetical protein